MERIIKPQSPLYLEAYIFVVGISTVDNRPGFLRSQGLDVSSLSLQPAGVEPDELRQLLTSCLAGCLNAAARDLSIDEQTGLDDEDAQLLTEFTAGSWPEAVYMYGPIAEDNPWLSELANPLDSPDTMREVWSWHLDKRVALPDLETLIRYE